MKEGMPLLVGALLALAAGSLARASRLDRDRAFYPTVAIVMSGIGMAEIQMVKMEFIADCS